MDRDYSQTWPYWSCEIKDFEISIPALPRPSRREIQTDYLYFERIKRDTSPVKAVGLGLMPVVYLPEKEIDESEYERRILPKLNICFGYQHANWLVDHQAELPTLMAILGRIRIFFPGLVAVTAHGNRYTTFISSNYVRWEPLWICMENKFRYDEFVAVSIPAL